MGIRISTSPTTRARTFSSTTSTTGPSGRSQRRPAWHSDRTARILPPWDQCSPISTTTARGISVAFGQNGENTSAMGPVFADFDNDGKVDLFVSDSKYNRMYRNLGGLMFDDITERAGISQLAAQYVSWGNGAQ